MESLLHRPGATAPSPHPTTTRVSGKLLQTAAAALLVVAASAQAQLQNGSFESGFTGWSTTGVTAVIGSGGGGAVAGSRQAYLDTSPHDPDSAAQTSSVSQTFTGSGSISFWWNFVTNEELGGAYNDVAYVTLNGVMTKLADVNSTFVGSTLGGFADMTGYRYLELSLGSRGTHTITFSVSDAIDGGVDSALLIDNVVVVVPEPAAVALFAFGLVAIRFATGAGRTK